MRSNQHCKTAVTLSACLLNGRHLMLTLQSAGPDLILLLALEVMLWTT
ncbi:hypothetical protein [uncultured Halopseudomonas sp.]|tara:strand:+ start:4869 stop:5012 length:144 start_codon:yes stop_codon:yes gene_type:complete